MNGTRGWLMGLMLLSLAAACSDDDGTAATTTVPAEFSACPAASTEALQNQCLDQVVAALTTRTLTLADGNEVTHTSFASAATDVADIVSRLVPATWRYSYDSAMGDYDVEQAATTPVQTTWKLGTVERVLWTCFEGADVTISVAECTG